MLFILFSIFQLFTTPQGAQTLELKLQFNNPCKGDIYISCFQNSENFLQAEKAKFSKILECTETLYIEGLDPSKGRAVIAYIDENRNGVLDLNFLGIPKEPYAISNKFRGKWKEPVFEDAVESNATSEMTLVFDYWKDK